MDALPLLVAVCIDTLFQSLAMQLSLASSAVCVYVLSFLSVLS
jgi:hypothetical protein